MEKYILCAFRTENNVWLVISYSNELDTNVGLPIRPETVHLYIKWGYKTICDALTWTV
jgi:hypothetical protein